MLSSKLSNVSVCFLGMLFVIFVVPETKGKTEEDMKAYFSGGKEVDEES